MRTPMKAMAGMSGSNPSEDTPTQHGFFMLGTTSVYFYHSVQFAMENHSYQMIFTVTIPAGAMTAYVADVQEVQNTDQSGDWVWIFNNGVGQNPPLSQLFTLPQIQIGEVAALTGPISRISTSNPATSVTIVPEVTVTVERLVYFRHFDYSQAYPNPLPYLIFGDQNGAYLAHYLTKLPDFDNLVQLAAPPAWLNPQQLEAVAQIDFPTLPFAAPTITIPFVSGPLPPACPLSANTTYPVLFGGVSDPSFTVDVQSIYWFDVTDVNAPA